MATHNAGREIGANALIFGATTKGHGLTVGGELGVEFGAGSRQVSPCHARE